MKEIVKSSLSNAVLQVVLIVVQSQELFLGRCPEVHPIKPFLITNYSGLWYEIEKYWFIPEAQSTCVTVSYLDNEDETFTVEITQQINGKTWENPGLTRYLSNDGSADFALDLLIPQSPLPFIVTYPYQVIATDYANYTIKFSCKQIGLYHLQALWILARERSFTEEVRHVVHSQLVSMGIDVSRLRPTEQNFCPTDVIKREKTSRLLNLL